MIAWEPGDTAGLEVGPHPDYTRWSYRYSYTDGACEAAYSERSAEQQLQWLLRIFHTATERDGVDPAFAHSEFSRIKEWREKYRAAPIDPAGREARPAASQARWEAELEYILERQRDKEKHFKPDTDDGPIPFADLWKQTPPPEPDRFVACGSHRPGRKS
jgi:hypothetical protein